MGPDHARAELSLTDLSPFGGTALYEAVLVAIRDHERAARDRADLYREVIVMLTDGENTTGRLQFDEVIDEARRSDILVYPVHPSAVRCARKWASVADDAARTRYRGRH